MASSLVRAYLLVYNAALSLGWLTILWPAMRYVASSMERQTLTQGTTPGLYRDLRLPLLIFQTAALLEVWSDLSYESLKISCGAVTWKLADNSHVG